MIDNCWLDEDVVASATRYTFYLKSITKEDCVSINLRSEIVDFFEAKLSEDEDNANVILEVNAHMNDGFIIEKIDQKYYIDALTNQNLLFGFYYFIVHNYIGDLTPKVVEVPNNAIRMIDHWDNFDGTIERGYAGRSIFFENNRFLGDYDRLKRYARLLASIGLNYIAINNVNVHERETFLISDEYLSQVKQIVDIFSCFGIKVLLSINFASPIRIGKLKTADPLDKNVIEWWQRRAKAIYETIPNFGGFLVKADSEGEPGPFAYGRDHTQGANMLSDALSPYGGIVIWRAFVYNSQQNWRDRSIDRAKAAYENFIKLDGHFRDNVILQIKFGPIDFQTREPIQPLFGALKHTNQTIEFQIAQEYTGHQIDVNYLVSQWTRVLGFDLHVDNRPTLLRDVPRKNSLISTNSGIAAVSNVGRDQNWTGNKLAQANLYGFGRIAWNNRCSAQDILNEWIDLSFKDDDAKKIIMQVMSTSNKTYESYTAPLGVGFMVTPHVHYGPSVDGYEFDRWGTYHFADRNGIGVDRTLRTGTGYTRQYSDAVYEMYENIDSCPDELLLFFHHVPYSHVLHNGNTVIQNIYNTHFSGAETVQKYLEMWKSVEGKVSDQTYQNVLARFKLQLDNAEEWRDQINTFFYRISGIKDDLGRTIYS